jgi:hypothetical protein
MADAIPPHIVAELRARLRAHVSDPSVPDAELGQALRELGAFARAHGVHVEQILVLLKDTFDRLTPHTARDSPADRTERLERLVTLCIRAYYAPPPPTSAE